MTTLIDTAEAVDHDDGPHMPTPEELLRRNIRRARQGLVSQIWLKTEFGEEA